MHLFSVLVKPSAQFFLLSNRHFSTFPEITNKPKDAQKNIFGVIASYAKRIGYAQIFKAR